MTDQPITTEELRREIRNKILQAKPEVRQLNLFGADVELRQPPLKEIMEFQQSGDTTDAAARMVQRYVFVPGTDMRVFEEADLESILGIPFGKDMQALQEAINDLTGIEIEVEKQEKNSEGA